MIEVRFVTILTFDANTMHKEINKFIQEHHEFSRKSLSASMELPANTFLKEEYVEIDSEEDIDCYRGSKELAGKYKNSVREFFNRNNIDGHVHAFSAKEYTSADSVSPD
ncbi:TPA: hypothetical protein SD378_002105 [Morganella morganii]|nr:hypothetical protein [Morganella morganii]